VPTIRKEAASIAFSDSIGVGWLACAEALKASAGGLNAVPQPRRRRLQSDPLQNNSDISADERARIDSSACCCVHDGCP
jgi:hypothetical protein